MAESLRKRLAMPSNPIISTRKNIKPDCHLFIVTHKAMQARNWKISKRNLFHPNANTLRLFAELHEGSALIFCPKVFGSHLLQENILFSWTWSLSQILKAGPWKCLNLIPCKNIKCVRKYPFFLNVGIISNFKGVPLKVFESHLQVKISNVQENILFSKNWALSHISNAGPWKCLNLICWMKVSNVQEIILFL